MILIYAFTNSIQWIAGKKEKRKSAMRKHQVAILIIRLLQYLVMIRSCPMCKVVHDFVRMDWFLVSEIVDYNAALVVLRYTNKGNNENKGTYFSI